jgi:tight adherence protein C
MPIVVWLGSAAVAASIPLAWWALTGERQVAQRALQNLSDQSLTMRDAVLDRSAAERFVLPLVRSVGARVLRFTPAGWVGSKTMALAKAGLTGRVTAEQILGAKIILPLIIGALLGLRLGSGASLASVVVFVASVVVAFFVPDLLLRVRADRRAEEITLVLPDVLDQLTISVEAGLGFEAALARIAQTDDHALAQELGRMLQDIQLGTSRVDALQSLADRSQVEDLRAVVLTLRQAESLGVPLARTLRTLAAEMREKRRFRAEERAHQLPIKMIFPLGLCILPALFVVILGPAMIRFVEVF